MAEHEKPGAGGGGHDAAGAGHDAHAKGHKKHERHAPHEEHEEKEEWVISFADNALLQMGFFVILLAMNMKPASDGHGGAPPPNREASTAPENPATALLDGAIAIREAFNNPVNMASSSPQDIPLIRRIIQRKEGESKEQGPPGDKENVQTVRPTDYHRISGVVYFEEGAGAVDEQGASVIADVTNELKGRKTIVEVRGHVSLAEAYAPVDKGMRLSFDRALAVAGLLRSGGIEWDQIRVVACGAGDRAAPIARNQSEQRQNQRTEIIITDEAMPSDPYARDPSGGAPVSTAGVNSHE